MRRLNCLRVIAAIVNCHGPCAAQPKVAFGPLTELRTDEGRLSFGTIVSVDVVSWSAPDAQDLLIARLWDGVYLYPSKDLQTIGEPIRLCESLSLCLGNAHQAIWFAQPVLRLLTLHSPNFASVMRHSHRIVVHPRHAELPFDGFPRTIPHPAVPRPRPARPAGESDFAAMTKVYGHHARWRLRAAGHLDSR